YRVLGPGAGEDVGRGARVHGPLRRALELGPGDGQLRRLADEPAHVDLAVVVREQGPGCGAGLRHGGDTKDRCAPRPASLAPAWPASPPAWPRRRRPAPSSGWASGAPTSRRRPATT